MKLFKHFFLVPLCALTLMASLSACVYNATTHTATFSTKVLSKDIATVQTILTNVENIPAVAAAFSKDPTQKAQFDQVISQVNTLASQVATITGGSVTVDVGSTWASSLASELQTALNIATPIAGAFSGSAATYLSAASQLVPVIQMLVTTFGVETPVAVATSSPNLSYGAALPVFSSDALRARLQAGIAH